MYGESAIMEILPGGTHFGRILVFGFKRDYPIMLPSHIQHISKTGSKTVNHTCYDPPSCKLKLNASTLSFVSFTWLLGVSRNNRFYPTKTSHNTNPAIVSITPLSGPSVANIFASLMLERQTPPSHLYGTSHMSSVEPVSRKHVRSVGAASSGHCRNAK